MLYKYAYDNVYYSPLTNKALHLIGYGWNPKKLYVNKDITDIDYNYYNISAVILFLTVVLVMVIVVVDIIVFRIIIGILLLVLLLSHSEDIYVKSKFKNKSFKIKERKPKYY